MQTAFRFFAASATLARGSQSNPLGEVLDLLTDLSAKVTKDGEAEAAAFKGYSEWCDDVSTNKGFEIKTATAQKAKLEAKIGQLSGAIETGTSKIAGLASDISAGDADLKSATGIRDKEAADFSSSEKELLEVIGTLGRASTILEREMQKNPAALAQISSGNLQSLLSSLGAVVDAAAFSSTDKDRLLALVQAHQGADDDDSELGAPSASTYKTHSSSILDVLEDLKEKAEGQLSDLRKAETNAKHNYNVLRQSLEDQLSADNKDMAEEKAAKAAAAEGKAGAEGDLTVTVADLQGAQDALAAAKANCAQVAANHDATVASRAEELKAISEAIEILKSTSSGAVGQTYSFFQIASGSRLRTHADLVHSEVLALVKKLARQQHSTALAQLASRISAVVRYGAGSGEDPFAKVKGLIESMIGKLQNEASAEATEKQYCDEEMADTKAKKDELNAVVSKLTSKIDQSAARSAELKAQVNELQANLATLAQEQAQMTKLRQEESAAYVQAKADLELGLRGVRKALVVLRDYYAAGDAAFVQQPALPEQHGKAGGAATSIIGTLEVVESDFATNLAKEETQEATAADEYDKMTQTNKITKATKEQDVKYKSQESTSLDKSISELSSDRETTNTELAAVLEYSSQLNNRCIAKPETYGARKQRREAEIAGLKEALTVLESETAFVQRGGKRSGRHFRGATLAASSQ